MIKSKILGLAVCASLFCGAQAVQARETKSFIISEFYPAMYSEADNCPEGLNPLANEQFRKALELAGRSEEEIKLFLTDLYKNPGAGAATSAVVGPMISERARFEGKAYNPYINPQLVPDPGWKAAVGRYSYGFNLDGRGGDDKASFEDPESHERGVNNQLFRLWGCTQNHIAKLPGEIPNYPSEAWEVVIETMPVWLVSVTGQDLSKDGDVVISVDRGLKHGMRDAHGHMRPDMTYMIDPDPKAHNELRGKIVDGEVRAEGDALFIRGDPFFQPEFNFSKPKIRFKLGHDGKGHGLIGGYMPWLPLYWQHASHQFITEQLRGLDVVGFYNALRRLADYDPDPVTGENRQMSTAWWIEVVPAFAIPYDPELERKASKDQLASTP